jgi:hypothetical protein
MADVPQYYDPDEEVSAEERLRRATCAAKATFATQALAQAAGIQAEWSGGQSASELTEYRCRFCSRWHLSRRP